jgi:voltage-gated potassium channel
MSVRQRVWELLEVADADDAGSRRFDTFIISLIVLNVVSVILESVPAIHREYHRLFYRFEVFSVAVFTLEYLARAWACTVSPAFARPIRGRIKHLLRPMSIVDLLAILPFYLAFLTADLRVLRAFRLFRLVRLFRLFRYSTALQSLGRVFVIKREELIVTGIALSMLILISASLMYFAEREAQPEVFSSIPATIWWSVVTLTTVGYGDVYPITTAGKFVAGIIAILGIGMVALPAGIISAGFSELTKEQRKRKRRA